MVLRFQNSKTIYKENEYWIDVHKDLKETLSKHISRYCWKKNVEVTDIEENLKICALYVEISSCRMIKGLEAWIQRMEGCCSNRKEA